MPTVLLRLILSVIIAYIIGRFYFDGMTVVKVGGLALILFGLAYLMEFIRLRRERDDE